jgi:hypothetical protein
VVVTHQRPEDRPEDDESFVFVTTGIEDAVAKAEDSPTGPLMRRSWTASWTRAS